MRQFEYNIFFSSFSAFTSDRSRLRAGGAPLVSRNLAACGGSRWKSSRMAAAMAGACPGPQAHSCAASFSGSSHAFRCSISFSPARVATELDWSTCRFCSGCSHQGRAPSCPSPATLLVLSQVLAWVVATEVSLADCTRPA